MKGLFWLIVMISPLILIVILFTIAYAEIAIRKYAPMVIKQINRAHNQNIINNGHIEHQTNIADHQTIIQQNKIINNAAHDIRKQYTLTNEDHALLTSAMNKYGNRSALSFTTTTGIESQNSDDKIVYLTPQHKVVAEDKIFTEILERKENGQSNSKIIREMFNVRGGDLYLKYNDAIKYYLDE